MAFSSNERTLPRSELPGMYGSPNASFTTGLSAPPISSEPLPAPMCNPVSQCNSPDKTSLPTNCSCVCAVCELIFLFLLVVGDDRLEQIFESLVTARVVAPRDLQEQALERVQTPQGMPRRGVRQARAQHAELVLPLAFGRADRSADR